MSYVKNGKYYQLSIRVDGRVTTTSFGPGESGRVLAEASDATRAELAELARGRREARAADLERYREARARAGQVDAIVAAVLGEGGIRRHQRGRWRMARPAKAQAIVVKAEVEVELTPSQALAEARRLAGEYDAARKAGDDAARMEALRGLKRISLRHPAAVIDAASGDVEKSARNLFCYQLRDSVRMIGVGVQLDELRDELGGPDPTPAVRLAAAAAAYAWAESWWAAIACTQSRDGLIGAPDPAKERHHNWAQRRFLRALKTLEEIKAISRRRRSVTIVEE